MVEIASDDGTKQSMKDPIEGKWFEGWRIRRVRGVRWTVTWIEEAFDPGKRARDGGANFNFRRFSIGGRRKEARAHYDG